MNQIISVFIQSGQFLKIFLFMDRQTPNKRAEVACSKHAIKEIYLNNLDVFEALWELEMN